MNHLVDAGRPQRLLLATDLSAHGDRPLERARQLAADWQAELALLTVREGPEVPAEVIPWLEGDSDAAERVAQRALARELEDSGVRVSLHLVEGDVADSIVASARSLDSALVIAGSARTETFGTVLLGSTVERLARALPQPLLVVRRRARGAYRRILVPTDFSDAAREALVTAVRLFPDCSVTVFHAQEAGIEGLLGQALSADAAARAACAQFIDNCRLPAGARERIDVVIAAGALETVLGRHVREHDTELAVIGLHSQPGVVRLLLGSTAERLSRTLACDTLLVRTDGPDDEG